MQEADFLHFLCHILLDLTIQQKLFLSLAVDFSELLDAATHYVREYRLLLAERGGCDCRLVYQNEAVEVNVRGRRTG